MADLKKENKNEAPVQPELLTEEEYLKRSRLKTRSKINRVTRVFGFFTMVLLIYVGIFDPLFELSYFGWIFNKDVFRQSWEVMSGNFNATGLEALKNAPVFDNYSKGIRLWSTWLPALGITVILIVCAVFLVYFLTYCIVDFVDMGKSIRESTRGIAYDIGVNFNDAGINKKKKKDTVEEPTEDTKKKPRRRKEKTEVSKDLGLEEYSSEQLDALLRGESIDVKPASKDEEKNLF